jgi:hypothetical protein
MATSKKHIAVYLDPAVQQALSDFCEQRGLKSRKGVVFSAGVNTALAEFFGISGTEESNTPNEVSSIPNEVSNTPSKASNTPGKVSNIPSKVGSIPSNIPSEAFAMEVMPGK